MCTIIYNQPFFSRNGDFQHLRRHIDPGTTTQKILSTFHVFLGTSQADFRRRRHESILVYLPCLYTCTRY